MSDQAYIGINTTCKRCRPVGDKQVTATEYHGQQNVEQGKPVPPANHLGDFLTVALTMSYHKLLFVSPEQALNALGRRLPKTVMRGQKSWQSPGAGPVRCLY
ncbi:hypothetical protein SDC9_156007 [bioreactor metagenome]|uniref:Uncharacterized protein n=1 Tax=bioreactor metagenome TaxID=1076179 RepID=A0A645F5D0_9ZZZZ